MLDGLAAFFASEADGREAIRLLMQAHGLAASQLTLLSPADAAWLPFTRRARRWSRALQIDGRPWLADPWLLASLGALAGALASAIGLAFDDGLTFESALFVFALATLTGAIGGAVVARTSSPPLPYDKFNRIVRRQLVAGRWVVLAHEVPWARQAAVVAFVRERSVNWCAVSAPPRWL